MKLGRRLSPLSLAALLLGLPLTPTRAATEDLVFVGLPGSSSSGVFGQATVDVQFTEDRPIEVTSAPASPVGGGGPAPVHTVIPGDTLWDIAARYCGSGPDWHSIYAANRDQIKDPHWIYPGQQFKIACAGGAAPSPGQPAPGGKGAPPDGGIGNGAGFLTNLPLERGSYRVSSGFGPRPAPRTATGRGSSNHEGIDLAAPQGTPIRAAGAGTVMVADWAGGYGYAVYIKHDNGWVTRYGHMATRPSVRAGQRVSGGEKIGIVGTTGNSSGPHLHFETRRPDGTAVNPAGLVNF